MRTLDRQWKIIDGEVHERVKIVAHMFTMGDVEDIDIWVADPIWKWQQTEQGKFIMEKSLEPPFYQTSPDVATMGYKIAIVAVLSGADATFYNLRYQ